MHLTPGLNGMLINSSELTSLAFHPDGHLLAAGTADGSIKLFDVKNGSQMHVFQPVSSSGPLQSLSFSENGTWIASAQANDSTVTVWDLRKLNALHSFDAGTPVSGLTWDYTGQFLAACGFGGVVVQQYEKKGKAWTEPLRKAVAAVDVAWGAKASSLVALTGDGAVSVLAA